MVTLITILHVIVCLFLMVVVLLQAGKGGGMGSLGSAGAQTVFGGSGAGNFLTRLTAGTAIMFMLTSLTLAYFASARQTSWLDDYEARMAAQTQREREQRERLNAAAGDAGAATEPAPLDEGAEPIDTGDQPAPEGDPASTGTSPAPGIAPAPGVSPAPVAEQPAPPR
jgi:preprotein translocase subunit SecG